MSSPISSGPRHRNFVANLDRWHSKQTQKAFGKEVAHLDKLVTTLQGLDGSEQDSDAAPGDVTVSRFNHSLDKDYILSLKRNPDGNFKIEEYNQASPRASKEIVNSYHVKVDEGKIEVSRPEEKFELDMQSGMLIALGSPSRTPAAKPYRGVDLISQ